VLEHVRESGFALWVVHGTRVYICMKRDNRGFRTLQHDEMQPVIERKFRHVLLKFLKILSAAQTRH
jgi:hypothetical protein